MKKFHFKIIIIIIVVCGESPKFQQKQTEHHSLTANNDLVCATTESSKMIQMTEFAPSISLTTARKVSDDEFVNKQMNFVNKQLISP
jgi:hypothetical protein